jgi:hypothetical protein
MASFNVLYKGPEAGEEGADILTVAETLADHYPLSRREALARLQKVPFTLISGLTREEADRHAELLRGAGAQVDVLEGPDYQDWTVEPEEMSTQEPTRGAYMFRGLFRAVMYNFGPGLLIIGVIFLAGAAQIAGAHVWRPDGHPFWALSATGWATVGLALLILLCLFVLRLQQLAAIARSPNQDSPLATLRSYFHAINTRHFDKALQCLAWAPDHGDLGGEERRETHAYFRALAGQVVLPVEIDPAGVSFQNIGAEEAELRVRLTTIARQPLSDGTRLRRTVQDVMRFFWRDGRWYLIDGRLLGQRKPDRLPMPGCRTCGNEVLVGQMYCDACGAPVPPYAMESEQWLAPKRKPDVAALLSAVVPGLGQTYNGQPLKGTIIAATCWMILPWAAGVIDAIVTAERINRKSSTHDLYRRPGLAVAVHLILFASVAAFVVFNAGQVPLVREIITVSAPEEEVDRSSIVARFRGGDGSYSILFPFGWDVTEGPAEEESEGENVVVRAMSPDGRTSILISTQAKPPEWAPCPQALEARRLLEEEGESIANFVCGSEGGRQQYRLDSYTGDRQWRRTLLVMAYETELVALAFACPVEQQDRMVDVFDAVSDSLRFAERSDTPIRR